MELLTQQVPLWGVLIGVGLYYIFMALVSGMEMPTPQSSSNYRYWFRVLHRLSANLERAAIAAHIPVAEDKG